MRAHDKALFYLVYGMLTLSSCQSPVPPPQVLVTETRFDITVTPIPTSITAPTTVPPPWTTVPQITPATTMPLDLRIMVENVNSLDVITKLKAPFPVSEPLDIAFSPDSKLLASVNCVVSDISECASGVLLNWDVATNQILTTREVKGQQQRGVAFSPDGRYIASRGFGDAYLWDVTGEIPKFKLAGEVEPAFKSSSLQFSPDGKYIAYLDKSKGYDLVLWELSSQKIVTKFPLPQSLATTFAFSPDKKSMAIAVCVQGNENFPCTEGQVSIIDISTGDVLRTFNGDGGAIAFDPKGEFLSASAFGQLALWNMASQQNIFNVPERTERIGTLAFSSDGRLLVSGGRRQGENVAIWDVAKGQVVMTLSHGLYVSSLSFSPDGRLLAIAASDGLFLLGIQ